jgi:hypothetical protein
MSDGTSSQPVVPAAESGESEDRVGRPGDKILTLLRKATDLAEGNSRFAVEIARNLAFQLEVAKDRLAELERRVPELEAAVQFYRNKSERAEEWLSKISSEIQERVIGAPH